MFVSLTVSVTNRELWSDHVGISKNPNREIMEGIWSDSKTFKLTELFEQYDCLYDVQWNNYDN